jgi:uncharacterized membrane protein
MPDRKELDRLWADPRNWPHGVYFCKQDPRLVVPKRRFVGGTFNFAHPLAIPSCLAILALVAYLIGVVAAPAIGLLLHHR